MRDSDPDLQTSLDALRRMLEQEREVRCALEERVGLLEAQVADVARGLRSVLSSRVWRALSTVGEGLLGWRASVTRRLSSRRPPAPPPGGADPRFSVLMPVYNTPERWLRAAVDSVLRQSWGGWELCIADDASANPGVAAVLADYKARDPRVRVTRRPVNGGIAAASNTCLEMARGAYVALLDHDDELAPHALASVARTLDATPDADLVYTDEDKIDASGFRFDPFHKPSWSPEYLLGIMYVGHLAVYRTDFLRELGGFRSEVDGAQDYDLALRASARAACVCHVPETLYHWRTLEGSMASGIGAKNYAYAAAQSALRHYLALSARGGEVSQGASCGTYRVRFEVEGEPAVRVFVRANRDGLEAARRYAAALAGQTAWRNLSVEAAADPPLRLSGEEYLVFVEAGALPLAPDWIERLLEYCQSPGVGAVGPCLLDARGRVSSAGILFVGGRLVNAWRGLPREHPGHFLSAHVTRNYLAVSGACLMTPARAFSAAGGFDPALPAQAAAVDYCLRLRDLGYRCVYTPHAGFRRPEGAEENDVSAGSLLRWRWGRYFDADPYYNPNLPREFAHFPPPAD